MSKFIKFLAAFASAVLVVTGLTVMPAQAAGSPYTVTEVKAGMPLSSELVAGSTRVYWKNGADLWTSDGTTTRQLKTFPSHQSFGLTQATPQYTEGGFYDTNYYINRSVMIGDTIYFWAAFTPANTDWDIWKSDGTAAGTVQVTQLHMDAIIQNLSWAPPSLFVNGTDIYFWSHRVDSNLGHWRDLRKLNTLTGTNAIVANSPTTEVCSNQTYGQNYQMAVVNGKLIFDYTIGCVNKIGSINLTSNAFVDLKPNSIPATSLLGMLNPSEFTVFNNKVYFIADVLSSDDIANNMQWNWTSELWSTDGTVAGTTQTSNLNPGGWGAGNPKTALMRPTVVGSYLYFLGWDSSLSRNSVYRTDGSSAPVVWIQGDTLGNAGSRTNVPGSWVTTGSNTYLVVDATHSSGGQQMYAVNLATKAATWLTPSFDATQDSVGKLDQPWGATDYTSPVKWDGKIWWLASTELGSPNNARNVYYSDGTVAGTGAVTTYSGDLGQGIGYMGDGAEIEYFARNATRPLAATSNALWFIRGPQYGTTWSLFKVTAAPVTPPTPSLTCSNQMTKLKVEAESASDLKQGSTNTTGFSGTVCEYNMTVDNKTSKVDFTPTFTGALTMKLGGTAVPSGSVPKSTKTYSATLGAAGTSTAIDFIFGSNTYRVNVQRLAAVAPGARDPQFTPPTVNGAVVTVDKDTKKETNQNGDKKETEVTYIGGSFTGKVAKLDDKGEKDGDFEANVPAIGGTVSTVKVDEQHRVLVGGENVDGNKDVVRLKPDGSKDNSFSGPDLGVGKKVDDIEVSKDGKVVIVGDFGDNKNVKKLKDNGSEDTAFTGNLPVIGGEVKTAKIQEDDKILIGGHFDNVGDADGDKIARLNKDGSIDNAFKPATNGAHFNDDVEDIETQKDGKIVVVGKSEKTNNDEADKVTRLNKDGHEDSSFNFDGNIPTGKKVEAVKVKDSGEIYIAGDFENVGDNDGDKIAKVKKDGHVDTDWNPPTQGGDVHDIELEKHGKVFVGGEGSGDGDRVDKVHEDGDRDGDKPRYDSIDDDRASNKVDTGTKGQTHIHGDGFKDGTTVTIGGKPATVVKIDDRDEDITVQVPTPDDAHKGGTDHERKPADIVITVPNGTSTPDVIEIKEGFGYTDKKEAQQISPDNDTHINSDLDDDDHKGKVRDDEALAAHIPSDDPITNVSKTPDVCTVDDENRVHYHHRGDCKIVTDAPGDMGHEDPAPVTEVIPVAGLDPELAAPTDPFVDPSVQVPESGYQIPVPPLAEPTIPVVYTPVDPNVCDVTTDGLVTPIDTSADCQVKLTTPGDQIYEPTAPTDPPVTVTIPHTAWLPPATITVPGVVGSVISDPDVPSASIPGSGGTVKLGGDLGFKYDKAKGTLTPTAWGIYFGPIKATINYSWTKANNSTGTGTCVVKWGVLKKWSSLSKADQKKYKRPLGAKVFTTTSSCKVNAAAKAALAVAGTSFTATSDVLRIRMWPATYLPKKPNNEPILPRTRHYVLTISTQ